MDGSPDAEGWQPGSLDRLRAGVRRALIAILGPRSEHRVHAWYHRFLRSIGRFGPPENDVTKALLRAVAVRSNTIIDVGANVGRYAWFLRRHASPAATLIALEPHPGAARFLREALQQLSGCTVLELAAADADGSAQLVVPEGAFGAPVPALGWVRSQRDGRSNDGIQVRIRRLDGLVDDGTVAVVSPVFLKIDVEGSEAGVLRGARAFLQRYRPILYFESQAASLARRRETPGSVWNELERAGYRTFAERAGRFVPTPGILPEMANYLGVPDLIGTQADEPLDEAAITSMLDAWVAGSSKA
jgi:FkbM family methyltransferase